MGAHAGARQVIRSRALSSRAANLSCKSELQNFNKILTVAKLH